MIKILIVFFLVSIIPIIKIKSLFLWLPNEVKYMKSEFKRDHKYKAIVYEICNDLNPLAFYVSYELVFRVAGEDYYDYEINKIKNRKKNSTIFKIWYLPTYVISGLTSQAVFFINFGTALILFLAFTFI